MRFNETRPNTIVDEGFYNQLQNAINNLALIDDEKTRVKLNEQLNIGTTYEDITELGFNVQNGMIIEFSFGIITDASAATVGIDVAMNGPASSNIVYTQGFWTSTTAFALRSATTYDANTASTGSQGAIRAIYTLEGIINVGADGVLIPRIKRENGAGSANVRAGSYGIAKKMN